MMLMFIALLLFWMTLDEAGRDLMVFDVERVEQRIKRCGLGSSWSRHRT